jgi:hypothetical protein
LFFTHFEPGAIVGTLVLLLWVTLGSSNNTLLSLVGGLKFGMFTVAIIGVILFITGAYRFFTNEVIETWQVTRH